VPGILFSNLKMEAEKPALVDIGPTVLNLLGVETPKYMTGRNLL
jgi:bisphosphoglycerate-independent phosphoglycerate mutase (AlkP superfamily)